MKKEDEERERWFLWIKKTTLRVKDNIENPIYLIRYTLFTCPLFSIKLHKILMSDDDCMHDHPWSFISIILKGGYKECTPWDVVNPDTSEPVVAKWYKAGSILWRPKPWVHKLEVIEPATTLVITFKKARQWGFYTKNGWKVWHEFIRNGRKCD